MHIHRGRVRRVRPGVDVDRAPAQLDRAVIAPADYRVRVESQGVTGGKPDRGQAAAVRLDLGPSGQILPDEQRSRRRPQFAAGPAQPGAARQGLDDRHGIVD